MRIIHLNVSMPLKHYGFVGRIAHRNDGDYQEVLFCPMRPQDGAWFMKNARASRLILKRYNIRIEQDSSQKVKDAQRLVSIIYRAAKAVGMKNIYTVDNERKIRLGDIVYDTRDLTLLPPPVYKHLHSIDEKSTDNVLAFFGNVSPRISAKVTFPSTVTTIQPAKKRIFYIFALYSMTRTSQIKF